MICYKSAHYFLSVLACWFWYVIGLVIISEVEKYKTAESSVWCRLLFISSAEEIHPRLQEHIEYWDNAWLYDNWFNELVSDLSNVADTAAKSISTVYPTDLLDWQWKLIISIINISIIISIVISSSTGVVHCCAQVSSNIGCSISVVSSTAACITQLKLLTTVEQ